MRDATSVGNSGLELSSYAREVSGVCMACSVRQRGGVVVDVFVSIPVTVCRHALVFVFGAPLAGYGVKRGIVMEYSRVFL